MRVQVRFFAILREQARTSALDLDLPAGATVATARDAVLKKLPQLNELIARAAYARNRNQARPEDELCAGDEVAFLPPVSGG